MLPVTHSGYRPAAAAVRRQAETERRGERRGGGSTDGITSVPLSYEKGRAEQS